MIEPGSPTPRTPPPPPEGVKSQPAKRGQFPTGTDKEIETVVRRWSGDDDFEYWRRWKQLGTWAMDRTQGDVSKKDGLKKRLFEETGGRCRDCGADFPRSALQMHRLDQQLAHQRDLNFGYVRENVVLVCAQCHQHREVARSA